MCLESFNSNLETILTNIKKDKKVDIQFYAEFDKLGLNVNLMYRFLHNYDYDSNHKANGFRSVFKICCKFLQVFEKNLNNSKYYVINFDLINILSVINTIVVQALELNEKLKEKDETDDNFFLSNQFEIKNLLHMYKENLSNKLCSMYGNSGFLWLTKSCRLFIKNFLILMSVYGSNSALEYFKCIWDPQFRSKILVNLAYNSNIYFLKSFWSLSEYSFLRDKLPNLILKTPTILQDVIIENRQNFFHITLKEKKVIKLMESCEKNISIEKIPIKCRLLLEKKEVENKNQDHNDNILIFHVHGGGFISQSPNSHEIYLREWSINLPNVAILSVDYSLSPQAKYPVALQQLLDAYIWLNSKKFINLIGYKQKKIILVGDSAGGNLVAALLLVLNDIRNKYPLDLVYFDEIETDLNFVMPSSLICVYTPFRLQLFLCPAKLMSIWDPILPLGVLLSCLEAYIHNNLEDDECKSNLAIQNFVLEEESLEEFHLEKFFFLDKNFGGLEDNKKDTYINKIDQEMLKEENFEKMDKSNVKYSKFIKPFYDVFSIKKRFLKKYQSLVKDLFKNSENFYSEPWYHEKDDEKFKSNIKKINFKSSYPYISPVLYDNFEQLKKVDLYLIALDYDVFLDDSVLMARRWKGKVFFDILEGLPHGFLNFNLFSEEAKNGTDLVLNRIKQAIKQDK